MTQDLPDRDGAADQLAIVERIEERLNDEARRSTPRRSANCASGSRVKGSTCRPSRGWSNGARKEPQAVLEADLLLETYEQALGLRRGGRRHAVGAARRRRRVPRSRWSAGRAGRRREADQGDQGAARRGRARRAVAAGAKGQ
jgi:hypothetical protein